MWRIEQLTRLFGPSGEGWYTEVVRQEQVSLPGGEVRVFTDINLYLKDTKTEEWSKPIRGTFDPDFRAVVCLCGPAVDERREFRLSEDGRLRFSTVSAWDKSDDVDALIIERFPSVSLAWSSGPTSASTTAGWTMSLTSR